jgi:hypothetical protein
MIALVFALLNPEPSRSLQLPSRLLFWTLQVGALLALMQMAQLALSRLAPATPGGGWVQIAAAGLVGAAAFAPVAVVLDRLFGLAALSDDAAQALDAAILEEFGGMAPPAVFTWLGLNALKTLPFQPAPGESRSAAPAAFFLPRVQFSSLLTLRLVAGFLVAFASARLAAKSSKQESGAFSPLGDLDCGIAVDSPSHEGVDMLIQVSGVLEQKLGHLAEVLRRYRQRMPEVRGSDGIDLWLLRRDVGCEVDWIGGDHVIPLLWYFDLVYEVLADRLGI